MFETPVTILTGLGMPTPVSTVMHAYRLLLEWPNLNHDPAHAVALKACKAALAGEIDAQTARSVFVAFAEKHNLLGPEFSLPLPDATGTVATRTSDEFVIRLCSKTILIEEVDSCTSTVNRG